LFPPQLDLRYAIAQSGVQHDPLKEALTALADALAKCPAEEIVFDWFRSGRLVSELSACQHGEAAAAGKIAAGRMGGLSCWQTSLTLRSIPHRADEHQTEDYETKSAALSLNWRLQSGSTRSPS
jgi:hypothetical protein